MHWALSFVLQKGQFVTIGPPPRMTCTGISQGAVMAGFSLGILGCEHVPVARALTHTHTCSSDTYANGPIDELACVAMLYFNSYCWRAHTEDNHWVVVCLISASFIDHSSQAKPLPHHQGATCSDSCPAFKHQALDERSLHDPTRRARPCIKGPPGLDPNCIAEASVVMPQACVFGGPCFPAVPPSLAPGAEAIGVGRAGLGACRAQPPAGDTQRRSAAAPPPPPSVLTPTFSPSSSSAAAAATAAGGAPELVPWGASVRSCCWMSTFAHR
eukprot:1157884-Pelagomonas_calceolata.AAC.2